MKQYAADTCTIAWFKLAECVSRGERERAFALFKLLRHALPDTALAFQTEGDLLWAFGDVQMAAECYAKAARTYAGQGRSVESNIMDAQAQELLASR